MAEKSKKPAIRFAGFTEAWEQRKFEDITYLSGERNRDNNIFESYSVTNDKGFVPQVEQFENGGTMATADKSMYYIVSKNSFAYNPARINVGSIGYYDNPEKVIVSSLYEVFKTINNINDRFLWHWFKSDAFQKMIEQYQEGGVRLYFYYDKLCVCLIDIPKYEEQYMIGEMLDKLDNLITLHQRKYDKLVNVKKAMLEKMFPKDGADVPTIRFKGFTEAWEQRKLGNLASFSKGYGYSKSDLMESGTPIILYGRLYTNYETVISDVDTYVNEKKGSVYSRGGEIIVPASGETAEDISVASVVEKQGVLLGGDLNIVNPAKILNPVFLAISISNGNPHKEMTKMAQGKSVVHLHNADLEKINLNFPSCDEQVLISTYFQNIDNIITLHQRKLEKLKNLKKACLEKMFV